MFVYDPDYTFEWPVKVKMPTAGEDQEFSFTAVFKAPDDEKDIFEKPVLPEGASAGDLIDIARARLEKCWVGWSGIAVKDGGELAFSLEARTNLLKRREIRMAVDDALYDAVMGIREKN